MRNPMTAAALAALLFSFLLVPLADAQIRLGPGGGYAAFLQDDGRLREVQGLAATLKVELPLQAQQLATGRWWKHSLYLGIPVVSDQNTLLWSLDANYARRLGASEVWGIVGVGLAFPGAALLANLDTRDPVPVGDEIETAVFVGPRLGFFGNVHVGQESDGTARIVPLEIVAGYLWHGAGLPQEVSRPKLIRLEVNAPFEI